jgi:hypothetical protein
VPMAEQLIPSGEAEIPPESIQLISHWELYVDRSSNSKGSGAYKSPYTSFLVRDPF